MVYVLMISHVQTQSNWVYNFHVILLFLFFQGITSFQILTNICGTRLKHSAMIILERVPSHKWKMVTCKLSNNKQTNVCPDSKSRCLFFRHIFLNIAWFIHVLKQLNYIYIIGLYNVISLCGCFIES
jgi:hypothetical protein